MREHDALARGEDPSMKIHEGRSWEAMIWQDDIETEEMIAEKSLSKALLTV